MARLFQSGAEIDGGVAADTVTGNLDPDAQWTFTTVSPIRDTSLFRSGAASWKFTGSASALCAIRSSTVSVVDGRSYFLRGYFSLASAPAATVVVLRIDTGVNGITARIRTDGAVELAAAGAARGSPSASSITDSSWHRIELKATATATSTWTAAELLVDGVSVATWSGSVARTNVFVEWGWCAAFPGASKFVNVDDVAVNDSTGSVNNSYPGDGKVVLLRPTGDSAVGTGWTGGAGATTSLFDAVNNTPPVGVADTGTNASQIRNASSNANVNYDATMTTYTAAGVGASDTINAVVPWVATSAPVATSAKLGTVGVVSNPAITGVNLGATGTAAAFWGGTTAGTYGTGWKWSPGTPTNTPTVTLGTAPVMRVQQVTASTRIADVCGMFMYVDYTPAGAPPAAKKPRVLSSRVAAFRAALR